MGGGTSKHNLHLNTAASRARRDRTIPLFSDETDNEHSAARRGINFPLGGLTPNGKPTSISGEINQEETTMYVFTLFVAMFYLLKNKFWELKNKKLNIFVQQIDKVVSTGKDSLFRSLEFKKFQDYCKNKSIHQYYGYEVVRRFLTKRFSDSTGNFMKLGRDEWVNFVNQSLKKQ